MPGLLHAGGNTTPTNLGTQVAFVNTSITFSQHDGRVTVPFQVTGNPLPSSAFTADLVAFRFQDVTTNSGDYEEYGNFDTQGTAGNLELPLFIKYTGSVVDKTFLITIDTGLLVGNYTVGTPSTITVTILGEPRFFIRALASPSSKGRVSRSAYHTVGRTVVLRSTPKPGFKFIGWRENGKYVSYAPSYVFTAERDRYLRARFSNR
ncbi:MAG: hypothetical protein ABIT76_13415 [Chthoniobacterales bacterium]